MRDSGSEFRPFEEICRSECIRKHDAPEDELVVDRVSEYRAIRDGKGDQVNDKKGVYQRQMAY